MHCRWIIEVQLTQGDRISLSQGWGLTFLIISSLWVARSVTCRVVLHFKQNYVSVIHHWKPGQKLFFPLQASTLYWFVLPVLTGVYAYQNICTLPFYMDIALLCLMEYKKVLKLCPYFLSTEICYFCDIHLWFSRYSWDFEPVWKWFFWWTELWIFCVAPQSVNCCCVQCDCCGFLWWRQ